MQKATRLANEKLTPEEREALTRAMLFDEAFALHFLEDVFASGHVAGTWGDTSQRKGTHDFYNEAGLEVFPWKGSSESTVLMGDAHMRPEDVGGRHGCPREHRAVARRGPAGRGPTACRTPPQRLPARPIRCMQERPSDTAARTASRDRAGGVPGAPIGRDRSEVLRPTPVPSLGPGLGAMPRYRSEVGRSWACPGRPTGGG